MPPFVPRQRKHKVRAREEKQNDVANSNQVQLVPETNAEREKRRQKVKEELSGQKKLSGKKQKRLNKYIETKLKKDDNLVLLKKLSQTKFDTSQLQSSKHLGKRKYADYTVDIRTAKAREVQPQYLDASDVDSEDSFEAKHKEAFASQNGDHGVPVDQAPIAKTGSGLKEPLALGSDGLPLIPSRQKQRRLKTKASPPSSELPWEGFDSESEKKSATESSTSDGSTEESSEVDTDSETDAGGDDSDDESAVTTYRRLKPRNSAFKAWATQQINKSLDFKPSHELPPTSTTNTSTGPAIKQEVESESADEPSEALTQKTNRQTWHVAVVRTESIQQARFQLPIVAEEQKIMEAIHNNPVVIIWGATGSGKTTQVPQFLFEAGYGDPAGPTPGMIGVTQPRRVAAVSMAKRVGDELGLHGDKVSYQIRFDSTATSRTAIKYMTDGILLREISDDLVLKKYSAIVIDEAHERSVNTDILIGMMSRIVELRMKLSKEDATVKPLRLVIMSATLRLSDFLQNANLFRSGPPPVVQAEGRQHPVTIHWARRTRRGYVEEAYLKILRGHKKLPSGGMVVFLTGQNEIKILMQRLKQTLHTEGEISSAKVQFAQSELPLETEDLEIGQFDVEEVESDVDVITDEEEEEEEFEVDGDDGQRSSSVRILPLYSQLSTKDQLRVFEPVYVGTRLIVLTTNVAETSLTIPGIRYVFDCGRSKERLYDQRTGIQTFEINWISKASAEQRAGRAGRTGPGHCYRLYSSAVYEYDFVEHADPEILRTSLESVILQMKAMGIDKVDQFPFPTPPNRQSLLAAERLLKNLSALTGKGQVTSLGQSLSKYPLSPRFGKMLAIGSQHGCILYVIALVAGLSVGELFIPENKLTIQEDEDELSELQKRRNRALTLFSRHDRMSDAQRILTAVCAYAYSDDQDQFCDEYFLRAKALHEVTQLRKQLTDIVRANAPEAIGNFAAQLPQPSPTQCKALNQIVAAGFLDQIAIRADLSPSPPLDVAKSKRAIDVPYLPLFRVESKAVYLHPSSILSRLPPKQLPQYLVYSHLQQSMSSYVASEQVPKIRMFPLTAVSGAQLAALARDSPLVTYGTPIGKIRSLRGPPEQRECWVMPSLQGDTGSVGWPLPAKKVLQQKDPRVGWVTKKFLT